MKILLITLLLLSSFEKCWSQQVNEIYEFQKIVPDYQSPNVVTEGYGFSVSISGNTAIVGAKYNGSNDATYIYDFTDDKWKFKSKLLPQDFYSFGGHDISKDLVAISENIIVICNPEEYLNPYGNGVGSAFIYEFNGQNWNFKQKIRSGDPKAFENFGSSVGISGNKIIIGCENDNNTGPSSYGVGAAYIFEKIGDTWIQKSKLIANDSQYSINFGKKVSIFGDQVAVGCPYHNENGEYSGAVYIFDFDGTTWKQTKIEEDFYSHFYFGFDVSIHAGKLLVGSFDNGAFLYEFKDNVWINTESFLPFSQDVSFYTYGNRVSLIENELVVLGSKVARYYKYDSKWNFVCNLKPALVSEEDIYFKAVDIGDKEIMIGARESVLMFDKNIGLGLEKAYVVYPNPSNDNININFFELNKYKITIRDINGKIIFSQMDNYGNTSLNISSFKNGIYIVELSGDDVNYFIRFQKM